MFFNLRSRLRTDPLGEIAQLIDLERSGHPSVAAKAGRRLADLELREKRDYVGLFEEVALVLEWGLLERKLAHYMFGYYAILCWESVGFWDESGLNKWNVFYWHRFHEFYWAMKAEEERLGGGTTIEGSVAPAVAVDEGAGAARVTLKIPSVLRPSFSGAHEVHASGDTVGDLLRAVAAEYPEAQGQLFAEDGGLHRYVNVYFNDEDVKVLESLETVVHDGGTLVILPGVSGG